MGKFCQYLTEFSSLDMIMVGYHSLKLLFFFVVVVVFCKVSIASLFS